MTAIYLPFFISPTPFPVDAINETDPLKEIPSSCPVYIWEEKN